MADTTKLFDKYGEFDSYEELNLAAAGQLEEGDIEALKELARENGIDEMDVEDYVDGVVNELSTIYSAANGRLDVQKAEIDKKKDKTEKMPLQLILTFTRDLCTREDMAKAVMKKGKRIQKIYVAMKEGAKNSGYNVSCGTDEQLRQIIRSYYLDSEQQFKDKIKALYE